MCACFTTARKTKLPMRRRSEQCVDSRSDLTSSFVIASLQVPVRRDAGRMLLPSTKQRIIWARFSVLVHGLTFFRAFNYPVVQVKINSYK